MVAMSDGLDPSADYIDSMGVPRSFVFDLDGDTLSDIDYPATNSGVSNAFAAVSDSTNGIKPGDEIIIFITDHGSITSSGESCIILWNNGLLTASDLKDKISSLGAGVTKHIVMGQCRSGGFINGLQGIKQMTVSTACQAWEDSYPMSNDLYDEFLYYWTSAFAGQYPDGTPVFADNNNDGKISPHEAFVFAQNNDSISSETPQFYEYKSLFGNIPLCYQYNYQEPYIIGPVDMKRGQTYIYQIKNLNPDLTATLVPNGDLSVVSSTDSTMVVSVNSSGGVKQIAVSVGFVAANPVYLNSTTSVEDVILWQSGTSVDSIGAIEAIVSPPSCVAYLTERFSLELSGFYWKTDATGWSVWHRILPEADFRFNGPWTNAPSQLEVKVDFTNPFGDTTTLTKIVDLTE